MSTNRRPGRLRRVVAWVFLALGAILLLAGGVAVWSRNQVLDTDRYVRTVKPARRRPRDPGADRRERLDRVSGAIEIDQLVSQVLPGRVGAALAPALQESLEQFLYDQTLEFTQSDQFPAVWEQINRAAHTQVVAVLTGRTENDAVAVQNGTVSLDLTVVVQNVIERLNARGITILDQVPATRLGTSLELFDTSDVSTVQDAADLLQQVAWVLPLAALVCLVAAVLLTPSRRKGLIRVGVAMILSMAALLVAIAVARALYLDALPPHVDQDAAESFYDIVFRYLRQGARVIILIGLLLALIAWLAGPGGAGRWVRSRFSRAAGQEGGFHGSAVSRFVNRQRTAFRLLVVGLGCLALVAWDTPTVRTVLGLTVAVVIGLLLVEFLAGPRRPAEPADEAQAEPPPAVEATTSRGLCRPRLEDERDRTDARRQGSRRAAEGPAIGEVQSPASPALEHRTRW